MTSPRHESESPRLVPDEPLPAYSYVPGRFPHPIREPAGHSHGQSAETVSPTELECWWRCRAYRAGIDLFNHGYYWEAHERWEAVWHAAGRRGAMGDFLKGLIKLAAALVKGRAGRALGVERHARRAVELFSSVALHVTPARDMMGLPITPLIEEARRLAAEPEQFVSASDAPVVRLTDFRLVLRSPNNDCFDG